MKLLHKRGRFILAVIGISTSLLCGIQVFAAPDTSSPLYGKRALFCGDSISFGQWDTRHHEAWAKRIGDQYGMIVTNASVGGSSLSTIRDVRIVDQIRASRGDYDYVILQGGVNDAWGNLETKKYAYWGKMSNSFDLKDFDTSTYAGGLEELFYYTFKRFPEAKVGYIYMFRTPGGPGHTGDMEPYYAVADQICAKWGVQVLDLYHDRYVNNTLIKVGSSEYLKDAIHPNAKGYDRLAPYIGEWMQRMTDTETYKENPYVNKRVLFVGDSICYGSNDGRRERLAWAGRMHDALKIIPDNRAVNGASLSTLRTPNRIVTQLISGKENGYDYVIMHGGINDAWGATNTSNPTPAPKGKISASYNLSDFDTSTFAGALEELFYKAYVRYPSARLGYIINYKLVKSESGLDMRLYDDVAREICKKWKVACLDLHNNAEVTKLLTEQYGEYMADVGHLSKKGYDVITPYIIEWFKTIPYADISSFESKMQVLDVPKEEDIKRVEALINAIGDVTEKNYKSKKTLIEDAESELKYLKAVYGDGAEYYVANIQKLQAARKAYNSFSASSSAKNTVSIADNMTKDIKRVEELIEAIGDVTENNYISKKALIENAELELSNFKAVYGDKAEDYITNLQKLQAASEAYNSFAASTSSESATTSSALSSSVSSISEGNTDKGKRSLTWLYYAAAAIVAIGAAVGGIIFRKRKK